MERLSVSIRTLCTFNLIFHKFGLNVALVAEDMCISSIHAERIILKFKPSSSFCWEAFRCAQHGARRCKFNMGVGSIYVGLRIIIIAQQT